jgi:hypothetical protein
LRVSRISLPMSCGVYLTTCIPFSKVTVREHFSCFGRESQETITVREHSLCSGIGQPEMFPPGNIAYYQYILNSEVAIECQLGSKRLQLNLGGGATPFRLKDLYIRDAISIPTAPTRRCVSLMTCAYFCKVIRESL